MTKAPVVCPICNKPTKYISYSRMVYNHAIKEHNITIKEFYDKFIKKEGEGKCTKCGKETDFLYLSKGYKKMCSTCYPTMFCKICNKDTDYGVNTFYKHHLKKFHNITAEEYYKQYINTDEKVGICKMCGKSTNFISIVDGFYDYCSVQCTSILGANKNKELFKNMSPDELKERTDKYRNTCLERYGDTNVCGKNSSIREDIFHRSHDFKTPEQKIKTNMKREKTFKRKYGVNNPMKLQSSKEKIIQTKLDKYGDANYRDNTEMLKLKKEKYTKQFKENLKSPDGYNLPDYELIEYYSSKEVKLKCPKGHIFDIKVPLIDLRLENNFEVCSECNPLRRYGVKEADLLRYIKNIYDGEIITTTRKIIYPYELDIYLPQLNLAFEFNGIYWHSTHEKSKEYHQSKTQMCQDKGVNLIHIWEPDWDNKQDYIKNMVKHIIAGSYANLKLKFYEYGNGNFEAVPTVELCDKNIKEQLEDFSINMYSSDRLKLKLNRDMWNGLHINNILDLRVEEPNILCYDIFEYYNSGSLLYNI
jgi:ribosomal protein L31